MSDTRVIVIGAGIAGLVATLELAARGYAVTLVEAAAEPGGKLREQQVDGTAIDAGPTVLTLVDVFAELFDLASARLSDLLTLEPLECLARHAWPDGSQLDLWADAARSEDAIARFAGTAEARRYRRFRADARAMLDTLEHSYLRASRPQPWSLAWRVGLHRIGALLGIRPFTRLWDALGSYFHDARLRQLFGRYATYCGSSPFLAPATLMLIAEVELRGVWRVPGGLTQLARALAAVAVRCGAKIRCASRVTRIELRAGAAAGVTLADGDRLPAAAVIAAGDIGALATGLLGDSVRHAVPHLPPGERSLSAVTWTLRAHSDFPLSHHNVFFSDDYAREFADLFQHDRTPRVPTVYVCAQDRDGRSEHAPDGAERLLVLVNAPACADRGGLSAVHRARLARRAALTLRRCGLRFDAIRPGLVCTGPEEFDQAFPGAGGAIYGRATHGWASSFVRPGARSRVPGLFLAGGSVHPGPGLPMAALSGRQAARAVMNHFADQRR